MKSAGIAAYRAWDQFALDAANQWENVCKEHLSEGHMVEFIFQAITDAHQNRDLTAIEASIRERL
jgi:hypothetical protein